MDRKNKMQKHAKAKVLSTLSILLVVICGIAIAGMDYVNNKLTTQMDFIIYAETFSGASGYLTDEVRSYAATGNKEHYDNYWYEVNTAQNREISVNAMLELGLGEEEQDLINRVSSISNGLIPLEEEAMKYTQAGNLDAAIDILYGKEYIDGITEIGQMNDTIQSNLIAERDHLQKIVSVLAIIAAFAAIAVLLVQIYIVRFVLKELIRPILKIRNQAESLAEGNLNTSLDLPEDNTEVGETVRAMNDFQKFQKELIQDIDYLLSEMANGNFKLHTTCEESYKGNYASILVSLRKINRTLDSTLKKIYLVSEEVTSASNQIATGSQSLAQSSTEQASSVEELSATITQISDHVQNTAEDSQTANQQMMQVGIKAAECQQQMKIMLDTMNNINQSSAEISKVIKVIEDIAFQTNILALNAAVEAARAGSAGKGFAVVADEVRNLAAKSAEASKNTSELITNSIHAVQQGLDAADATAASLMEVVTIAQDSAKAIEKIAESAEMEATSIRQVTEGVSQISIAIHSNSATSEESAATSEELSAQANIMKNLLDNFKL